MNQDRYFQDLQVKDRLQSILLTEEFQLLYHCEIFIAYPKLIEYLALKHHADL